MKLLQILIFKICLVYVVCAKLPSRIPKALQENGYKYDVYKVTTSDNYILKHYRIYPKDSKGNGKVVVLGAGLGQSGEAFLRMGPDYSLGYFLADKGYEVWLLNFRGTSYSLGHTELSTSDSKYWEFSFHEMGMYDLPESIDFILLKSKQKTVTYIAYSESANAGFVMLSELPDYNKKLKSMITISPLPFGCHATSKSALLIGFLENFGVLSALFNNVNMNLLGFFGPIQEALGAFKEIGSVENLYSFVDNIISNSDCKGKLIEGFLADGDKQQLGSRQISHFAQLFSNCNFRPYKGLFKPDPQPYDLQNVVVDLYGILAEKDDLSTPENFELLELALPNGYRGVFNVNKTHSGVINCPAGSSDLNKIIDTILKTA